MSLKFHEHTNLFFSISRFMSAHRRGVVRGTVLLLTVSLVALVAIIPTPGNAMLATCSCSGPASPAFVYDSADSITIKGSYNVCAEAVTMDECGVSPGGPCETFGLNTGIGLTSCGKPTNSWFVTPINDDSDASLCADADSDITISNSVFTATASTTAMTVSFASAATFNSEVIIYDTGDCAAYCEIVSPCAHADASITVNAADPFTFTIPFELCKEQVFTVFERIKMTEGCGDTWAERVSGNWSITGEGEFKSHSLSLSMFGNDSHSAEFSLGPGNYTFTAEYEMSQGVFVELAGCTVLEDGDDCGFTDSYSVAVTVDDP